MIGKTHYATFFERITLHGGMKMKPYAQKSISSIRAFLSLLICLHLACAKFSPDEVYDLVIMNGRVVDPESRLDKAQNLGIRAGTIQIITDKNIKGNDIIDATGLVVSPGFIDMNINAPNAESFRLQARDGVTTTLALEAGTNDIDKWYEQKEGKGIINYGASVDHVGVRIAVMNDPVLPGYSEGKPLNPTGDAAHREATPAEIGEMQRRIEHALKRGAVAVGFGIRYTPAASNLEILEMFRIAARYGASCHIHMRGHDQPGDLRDIQEVISAAAITGGQFHITHINSSYKSEAPLALQMIAEAQSNGLDVTVECYPYTAGMTTIESAFFDGWENKPDEEFDRLQWVENGERLTRETFIKYRKKGGEVIIHTNPEELIDKIVSNPLPMIASDGYLVNGKGHPRTSGTFSKVLGRYVREKKLLSLPDALARMTIMPARRLERFVPMMKKKGRISAGADADLTIFDADRIIDRSTYTEPANYSEGIEYVLVNGVLVVKTGQFQEGVFPGRPIREPIR